MDKKLVRWIAIIIALGFLLASFSFLVYMLFFGLRGYRGYIYEDIDDKGVQRHIKTNGDKKHCVESRKGRSRTKQCKRDYGSKKWHKGIMHHKAVRSGTKA